MPASQWPNTPRVIRFIKNHPDKAVRLIAQHCEQKTLDELYANMFPEPDVYQKRVALQQARQVLEFAGFAEASTPVAALSSELSSLPAD